MSLRWLPQSTAQRYDFLSWGKIRIALIDFGYGLAYERKERKWSQADIAKMLTAKGIDNMHHTTVAKIESGDREIKLDEAAAMADLFGLPLDSMMGRQAGHTRRRNCARRARVARHRTAGPRRSRVGALTGGQPRRDRS